MIDINYRGPTELVQHFADREIHIGVRALLVILLMFVYVACFPAPVHESIDILDRVIFSTNFLKKEIIHVTE
jgi:hypothetical protein